MIPDMTRSAPALAAAIALFVTPVLAQDEEQPGSHRDMEEGMQMLSEGARKLLRGLVDRAEPEMRDLAESLRNFNLEGLGPEDLGQYHAPEVLPNGDIIIRRKIPREGEPLDGEVEL